MVVVESLTNPLTGNPSYIFGITTSPLGDVSLSPSTKYELPSEARVNFNPVIDAVRQYRVTGVVSVLVEK